MLRLEGYVEIQVLHRQGKGIRAISAELGIARNTVRKYRRSQGKPKARARPPRPSKLDPFRRCIQDRQRQAHPQWIPASVLYREILDRGYSGKSAIVAVAMIDVCSSTLSGRPLLARGRSSPALGSAN